MPSTESLTPVTPATAAPARRPLRDNTPLLLLGVLALVAVLAGLLRLASRSAELAPDFLSEVVLYALSATNLSMLLALVFVLARNIVKLVLERRRALPFARFRGRLVSVLLAMTIVPAVLVLIVGSEVIRNSVDRWFNAPMEEVLSSANRIAGDYYQERQQRVSARASGLARRLAGVELTAAGVQPLVDAGEGSGGDLVEVYGLTAGALSLAGSARAGAIPGSYQAGASASFAARVAAAGTEIRDVEALPGAGELIRSGVPIRSAAGGAPAGVVVTADYVTTDVASRARRMTAAYEAYQQLRVLKQPLTGVYLSFFLMLTLMILVSATWLGIYVAKRITRPVQVLAAAANEIGAGHLDYRVEPEGSDEFGSLIEAFNRMAGELAASRRRLERSAVDLERRHQDVEARRRYVETVLERIATGVVSVDTDGRIRTWNSAASTLLGIDARVSGMPASVVFGSAELQPLGALIAEAPRQKDPRPHELALVRDGRELHLTAMATPLRRDDGTSDGVVAVFDDVSPLIRAQKVAAWREVARRLAHEIKNPLTPIQLCAERLRRHFAQAPSPARELVDECTSTIVGEVESLKGLVDEFSQFARMPAPRAVPSDLHAIIEDSLALYRGLFAEVELRPRFAPGLPKVAVDPEQLRRVLINLIDNAIEAMDRHGAIDVETQHDPANALVRIVIADNGPGVPPEDREKLFLPYYSTKRRGSGLGLAIVRRIIAEHGGNIELVDNEPRGSRFVIELPA